MLFCWQTRTPSNLVWKPLNVSQRNLKSRRPIEVSFVSWISSALLLSPMSLVYSEETNIFWDRVRVGRQIQVHPWAQLEVDVTASSILASLVNVMIRVECTSCRSRTCWVSNALGVYNSSTHCPGTVQIVFMRSGSTLSISPTEGGGRISRKTSPKTLNSFIANAFICLHRK